VPGFNFSILFGDKFNHNTLIQEQLHLLVAGGLHKHGLSFKGFHLTQLAFCLNAEDKITLFFTVSQDTLFLIPISKN
jgi:hypothetical protein